MSTGFLVCPFFMVKGPAKSIPVCVKGMVGLTLEDGRSPMRGCCRFCRWGCLLLQVMHLEQTALLRRLAPSTWSLAPAAHKRREGPQWLKVRCRWWNHFWMSGSLASEMMGCCCERVRLELASRPPTLRICLASRKGCRAFSLLDLDSVFPLRTAALSGENRTV